MVLRQCCSLPVHGSRAASRRLRTRVYDSRNRGGMQGVCKEICTEGANRVQRVCLEPRLMAPLSCDRAAATDRTTSDKSGLALRGLLRRAPTAGPGIIAIDAPSSGKNVLSGSRVTPGGHTVPASRRGCAGDAQGMRYPPATPPPGVFDRQNAPATRRRTPRAELSWPDRPITRTGPGSHARTAARAVTTPESADRERKRQV
jgi:hypothetical protein